MQGLLYNNNSAHNSYRKIHQAPPLTYNKEITKECQEWANYLAPAGKMEHSTTKNGENIWYKWATDLGEVFGKEAVDAWYNEIKDYNFNEPGFKSETGHFTQLVWKSTTEMGIAYAVHENVAIAVAQYSPAGNITNPSFFEENVLPPATSNTGLIAYW
uniref:SCP domain-containing protein n=1 Tax=Callorhinchus milii TaxID=7868 RepID=A0A4W3HFM0_CALMI